MKPFISDMPMHEYHDVEAIRSSEIRALVEGFTPAHILYRRNHPSEPTAAMILGTVVHAMVSGHEEEFALADLDGRTKAGKAQRAEIREAKPHAVIVNSETYETAKAMARSVFHNKEAKRLIETSVVEGSFFWREDGVLFKSRPDFVNDPAQTVLDLKTARSVSFDEFVKAVKYGFYDLQAYMQLRGLHVATERKNYTFRWIAVDKEPPYPTVVYPFTFGGEQSTIQTAWEIHANTLMEATKNKVWPTHSEIGQTITEDLLN